MDRVHTKSNCCRSRKTRWDLREESVMVTTLNSHWCCLGLTSATSLVVRIANCENVMVRRSIREVKSFHRPIYTYRSWDRNPGHGDIRLCLPVQCYDKAEYLRWMIGAWWYSVMLNIGDTRLITQSFYHFSFPYLKTAPLLVLLNHFRHERFGWDLHYRASRDTIFARGGTPFGNLRWPLKYARLDNPHTFASQINT